MRVKKRKKASRFRGTHSHGRGFKKRARGKGNRGGKGMAGTGKRADHRKSMVINLYGNDYFGKSKTLRRGTVSKKLKVINLSEIAARGLSKNKEIDLTGFKILSEGEIKDKVVIKASAASQSAIDKVKKAGGDIIIG